MLLRLRHKKALLASRCFCGVLLMHFIALISACNKDDVESNIPKDHLLTATVATKWADMSLYVIRRANYNSPTYSSRSLGYLGLTMYESVVNAYPTMQSMSGQLNGLVNLPEAEPDKIYYWPLVLNSGQETMLKLLYPNHTNITPELTVKIDSLFEALLLENSQGIAKATVNRSLNFGKSLATAIYEWSKTDGGDKGFLRHFDPAFIFPSGASFWVPPVRGQTISKYPLHPYWGQNRTFVLANTVLSMPSILTFSSSSSSDYYKNYYAVYEKNKILTQEEKEIAAWWADDPTQSFSPPGHSYNLATIAIKKANAPLGKAAETYARVGLAVADSFINCWKTKFKYFNERPSTFIKSYIDPTWVPYWPEPPFPAFPSGHSTQSAAAATVLTALYGENFPFTDNSHEGDILLPFNQPMKSRSFNNFWESSEESGLSRFLGGIHTQQDNEVGLAEGKKIGQNINALSWGK
jgi:hypothetical protein